MDNSTTYNKVDEREIKQKHLQHSPTLYNLAIPQFINSPSSVPDSATLSTSQYNDLQAQKDFLNPFYTSRQSHNSNGAKKPDNKQFIDTLTSTVGALLVTIILYPLENIRTRVSVSQLRVNYVKSIAEIVNSEGFYGLYRGLTSSLIGVLLSWGIYHGSFIFLNSTIKSPYLGKGINYDSLPKIGAVFLSVLISTPVWVVNTRKTLDKSNSMSFWSDLKQIAHTERFISLFSGFIPSLLISLSPALNIFLLSRFKNILLRLKMITKKVKGLNKYNYSSILNSIYLKPEKGDKIKSHFTFKESFLIGMLSKLVISFLFYPFRVCE
uniref:Solute carrier family 25 member 17 n=1 Tax=Nephromyces sp. MMRI TaxID=2496275 RepID=A0A3Q8UC72_9APIC|nr:solute carrier family 25 member 17 [Nephromyces sp. MMRI]AZL94729.1 solute carrier family 25 member 17 [Nephromyces sp. MMRI]